MRIFSNFDTNIKSKTRQEYVAQYGESNVLCFGRSKYYWLRKIFFPMFFLVVSLLGASYFFYWVLDGQYLLYLGILDFILLFLFSIPIVGRYIEYTMDFVVVTPDFLVMYDQQGIWNKKIVTVNEKSIKTISVEKPGFWYSVFDNGNIIFLSEGDMVHGEITLKWVPRPEKRRDQIATLMNKDMPENSI